MAEKTKQMEYTIKELYTEGDCLRVIIEHEFSSKQNIGLRTEDLKLDPRTDKPRYLSVINKLLEKQYGDKNRKKIVINNDNVGKIFKHKDINIPVQ